MKFTTALIGIALLVFSCRKETSWNSDWVVPLMNDTLDLNHFVNDTTLEINSGFYTVNLNRTLFDVDLTDFVAIPDTTIEQVLTLQVSSLTVTPGTEFVNSAEEHELDLQDLELKKIDLKEGYIDLRIENPFASSVILTIELPGVTKNGVTLIETHQAPPSSGGNPGILTTVVDLAGYSIDLTGINGNSYNLLRSKVKVKTAPGGNTITVTNQDHTVVKAKFRDVKLNYARGYFGSRVISDTTTFNLDFFNNVANGAIDLPATSVKLKLENGIKMDANGSIGYLKNTNAAGTIVSLMGENIGTTFQLDQPTGNAYNLQPFIKELLFTSSNSNVEEYFENLGSKHELAYAIHINPWGNTSGGWNEVFPQSRMKLSVEAQLPLSIRMDNLMIRDTFEFKLDQSKDKSHIAGGSFELDIDNAFPFSGQVKLIFYDEDGMVIGEAQATEPVKSSLYGQLNNNGVLHQRSRIDVPITTAIMDRLGEIRNVAVEAIFNTPDPTTGTNQMVAIPAYAYFAVKGKAKFQLKTIVK